MQAAHRPMRKKPTPILPERDPPDACRDLQTLLNLGPKSAAWLVAAKIDGVEIIRELGPIEICRRLRAGGQPVSVVMAYALEGALTSCHWNAIPWETKEFLRAEFAKMKEAEVRKPQSQHPPSELSRP
jgi:DNA transformation protein and related proteins